MMRAASRRHFLKTALMSGTSLTLPAGARSTFGQSPAVVTSDRMRPQIPSGLQMGDVLADRAVI